MNDPFYPNHRIPYPKDEDYVPEGHSCANCGSAEVVWLDKDSLEVECYDCGSIYFLRPTETTTEPSRCDHEWEYSDQSEPHKGREYFACRKCEVVAITDGDEVKLVPDHDGVGRHLVKSCKSSGPKIV